MPSPFMNGFGGVAELAEANDWYNTHGPTFVSFEPHWGRTAALVTLDCEQRPGLVGLAVVPWFETLPNVVALCQALNIRTLHQWQPLWMPEFRAWMPASTKFHPNQAYHSELVLSIARELLARLDEASVVLLPLSRP